ncbi:MAG: hypothetical protein Q8M76_10480 [Spirochaetaceae bacterium]|nr:hypothetical protein [Spirochaetaceae bacterium]
MPKTRVLILVEDGKTDIEKTAGDISERIDPERFEVLSRKASEVVISDVLAAGLFLLGADAPNAPSFAELARVMKGINLAGRRAAFFGSSGAAVAWLRGLCADTDLSAAHADLVGKRTDRTALAAWIRTIA